VQLIKKQLLNMSSFVRFTSALAALTLCTISLADPVHPALKVGDSAPQPAEGGFTVEVKMTNPKNYPAIIFYQNGEQRTRITNFTMEDGYQVFKGSVDGIVSASLVVRSPNNVIKMDRGVIPGPMLSFIVRNGARIVIEGDAEKAYMATVKSDDKETQAYEIYQSKDKVWQDQEWTIAKEWASARSAAANDGATSPGGALKESLEKQRKEWMKAFVKQHPDTFAAIIVFSMYALDLTDAEQAAQFAALPATYKNTDLGKRIQSKIDETTATGIGKPVAPFSIKGSDGKVVDIAALKGKVVLIDFWGSWCAPCRATHPHLKELYAQYKTKGFEIIGVGTEHGDQGAQDKAWREAIRKDGITWLQVLNQSDPSTDIAKMYGVVAYPTKILVDRNGVVKGRFLGDSAEAFEPMLNELMGDIRSNKGATGRDRDDRALAAR
jgi:thiol-disulfide isomerase/thioredoxin